jgi:hypothetical protein
MSVAYEAVLDVSEDSVQFLADLLGAERVRRGTRRDTRALSTRTQAVLVLRWFLDDTRMSGLARDNGISSSTAYAYRDEGIAVLEALVPSLHGALLAAGIAGYAYVIVDGTLIRTDRISTPGPTVGVDLWWSGKHWASTSTMAGTCGSCRLRTGGLCGPPGCGRGGSTT